MKKTIISTAIASVLCAAGFTTTANAGDLQLTFTDNTTSSWGASKEFAVTTNYGSVNDGAKDIFFGGETWTFQGSSTSNLIGAMLSGVSIHNANGGASGLRAPITDGQSGFPICATANTCDVLEQDAPFFGSGFNFLAPTIGSAAATAYGSPMKILAWDTSGTPGSVQIWLPVANAQWAGGNYIVGADPTRALPGFQDGDKVTYGVAPTGPGVTFIGSASGGTFHLTAALKMTRDEVTVPAFASQTVNWDVTGSYSVTPHGSQVPVPAAAWLLGSGLFGIAGCSRMNKKRQA